MEAESEENANKGKERQKQEMETQEMNENLLERMMSWVELENERQSKAETMAAEGIEKVGDATAQLAQLVLLQAEGGPLGETDREQTHSVEEELAMMEEKWREQCVINETLKQRLADEEERFRVRKTGRKFAHRPVFPSQLSDGLKWAGWCLLLQAT